MKKLSKGNTLSACVKEGYGNPPKGKLWPRAQYKNCCYCERTMKIKEVTREHIIPKSAGGSAIAPCCLDCNREKGCMDLLGWLIYLHGAQRMEWMRRRELQIKNTEKFLKLLYSGEYNFLL